MLPDRDNGSGTTRISRLFQAVIDAVRDYRDRRGCLLCNAAVDQVPFDPETEEIVKLGFSRMEHAIESALDEIGLRSKQPVRDFASQILAAWFGYGCLRRGVLPSQFWNNRGTVRDQ